MFRQERQLPGAGTIALAVGTTVGVAAAVLIGWRARRRSALQRDMPLPPEVTELEEAVVEALGADDIAGNLPIEVEAIATGIIELTGTVDAEASADRAVQLTQAVPGVRTVLNRLDVAAELSQLESARRRADAGEPAFRETRWYGIGVGTGRRRQSRDTDPAKPDDRIHMVAR
jgi:hypothetical protein